MLQALANRAISEDWKGATKIEKEKDRIKINSFITDRILNNYSTIVGRLHRESTKKITDMGIINHLSGLLYYNEIEDTF